MPEPCTDLGPLLMITKSGAGKFPPVCPFYALLNVFPHGLTAALHNSMQGTQIPFRRFSASEDNNNKSYRHYSKKPAIESDFPPPPSPRK